MLQKLILDWLLENWENSQDPAYDAHEIVQQYDNGDNQELLSELNNLFQAWITNEENARELVLNTSKDVSIMKSEAIVFAKKYVKSQEL